MLFLRTIGLSGCLLLGSCSTFQGPSEAPSEPPAAETATAADPSPQQLANSEVIEAAATDTVTVDKVIGSNTFVSTAGGPREPAPLPQGTITLNFNNADLKEVASVILDESLGVNYIIDARVQGTVNFSTSAPVTYEVALDSLEILLQMNNAALIRGADLYRIVPLAEAPSRSLPPRLAEIGHDIPPGYAIQIIPLKYISASEIEALVEPFLTPGTIKRIDTKRNLLLVGGTGNDLETIVRTVRAFDVDWLKGMSVAIFTLQHTDPNVIIADLKNILTADGSSGMELVRLFPIERKNAILAVTHNSALLEHVETWVGKLDAGIGEGQRLFVYYVEHGKASNLAEILSTLYSNSSGGRSGQSLVAPGRTAVKVTSDGTEGGASANRSSSSQGGALGLPASGDIRFIADETTNAILIATTPSNYRMIEAAIKKIDIAPTQVLIEATIAEVTLGDEYKFGLQWAFDGGAFGLNNGSSRGVLSSGNSTALSGALPGFSFIISDPSGARAVLDAISTQTEVNVISSPTLLVLNHQTANLQVGDEVPITTQQRQSTTDSDAQLINSIEFRDTGVILDVTPSVSSNGTIILEIAQEVSNVSESVDSGVLTPTISQRKINSVVSVKSGETIVLGGLISELKGRSNSGVPLLSKIPFLGSLFGSKQIKSTKTELIILLTPKVIQTSEEAVAATGELEERMQSLQKLLDEKETPLIIEMLAN